MRVVPLYVNFGAESFRDHVDIGSHDFYDRLRAAPSLPTTSQPTPQDFARRLRAARGVRADLLAAALREALRHVPVGRHRGRDDRRRPDPRRRHRDGLARGRPARARDPAPPRPRHDRRGDRGADRAVQGGERRRLHGRDARVPAEGRPHRPRGGARRDAAQREADPLRRRRRRPPDREGARAAEGARGVRARLHLDDGGQRRACGSRSRTRRRPSGSRCSPTSPRRRARRARSSSSRTSAPSSARTPARARSASSGSRISRRCRRPDPVLYSVPVPRGAHRDRAAGRLRRHGAAGAVAAATQRASARGARGRGRDAARRRARRCGSGSRSSASARSATCSRTGRAATSARSRSASIRDLFGDEEAVIEGVVPRDLVAARPRPAEDPHRARSPTTPARSGRRGSTSRGSRRS